MDFGMERARQIGAARVLRVVNRLFERAAADLPPGVRVERLANGVALIGKRLRARAVTDVRLRRIGR